MGAMPEWYGLLQAARYLQCAPWELIEQPVCWREWALDALAAENMAEKNLRNSQPQGITRR